MPLLQQMMAGELGLFSLARPFPVDQPQCSYILKIGIKTDVAKERFSHWRNHRSILLAIYSQVCSLNPGSASTDIFFTYPKLHHGLLIVPQQSRSSGDSSHRFGQLPVT